MRYSTGDPLLNAKSKATSGDVGTEVYVCIDYKTYFETEKTPPETQKLLKFINVPGRHFVAPTQAQANNFIKETDAAKWCWVAVKVSPSDVKESSGLKVLSPGFLMKLTTSNFGICGFTTYIKRKLITTNDHVQTSYAVTAQPLIVPAGSPRTS